MLVTGCVAQTEGDIMVQKEKYIDAVLGPQSFHQINDLISSLEKKFKPIKINRI